MDMMRTRLGLPIIMTAVTVTVSAILLTPMAAVRRRAKALPGTGGSEDLLLADMLQDQSVRNTAGGESDKLQHRYLLKLRGNTLSVYQDGSQDPAAVYELHAKQMPDYDRILLEYGMSVENESDLRRLLEDYVS